MFPSTLNGMKQRTTAAWLLLAVQVQVLGLCWASRLHLHTPAIRRLEGALPAPLLQMR